MGGEPEFGTQSCPIELENEEDEDNESWSVGHRQRKALLKPLLPAAPHSTDITMMDASPPPMSSGLEIVPFNNLSPSHEPSASRNSANPKVTAPVSPSIEDLANPRIAESGNHSPGDAENPGTSEGLWALDDATDGGTLRGASRGFKRLTKGHRISAAHVKEHTNGANDASLQKTELEREMELYEAAEREEEARLLTSLRHNPSGDCSPSQKSPNSMESIRADWKHEPGASSGEQSQRKGGRRPGVSSQALRKEEDVCFACFDGGDLILCDKRSCPKAYHMECTGRESEFFLKKGQWFCGWHVCAHCARSATMHCYTCPNAYCNDCTKDADFLSVRKNRGLCEQCYRIVYMIEHNLSIDDEGEEVNFDDEETYECLFRDYWKDLKEKLLLSWSEINKAFKAKDEGGPHSKSLHLESLTDDEASTDSDCRPVIRQSQRLKRKRVTRNATIDDMSGSDYEEEEEEVEKEEEEEEEDDDEEEEEEEKEKENLARPKRGRQKREFIGWASKELLDFLHALKEDSKKPLTLLLLNKLVLSYVEGNKLHNPRRRGKIRCDERLQNLFGRKHVGKFEMMKLLNKHIASKRGAKAKIFDMSGHQENADFDNGDDKVHKQWKLRKKMDDTRKSHPDPSKYAAIDVHNISLIYLKRSLLEDLQKDSDFESKVKGAFVRIRVPSLVNKNDTCYRLVQIAGIKEAVNPRSNAKTAHVMLEILNLQKREEITIDLISGQDFTEEECQRLRQSVKCGLLKAMTVGELREKAKILREAKIKDWFSTELVRLSHLRDRASEKGRKKDLRECVERLQVLGSPSEKERQLRAPIEIHVDPQMDPDYESENSGTENNHWDTGFGKKQRESSASVKHANPQGNDGWGDAIPHSGTWQSKSKVVAGVDQKDMGRDKIHSGKPVQGWNAAANEKNINGHSRMGLADDAGATGHHTGSLNHQGRSSQEDLVDHNATMHKCQGVDISNDDGWGEDLEGNQQDFGWGGCVDDLKRSDGWGEKGDGLKHDDGWGGGNAKGDKWAGNAVGTTKSDGWGAAGSIKKDGGWNCNAEGFQEDMGNRKKANCDRDVGGGMREHSRGGNFGTNEMNGWGDVGADGKKQVSWGNNAGVNSHNDGWGECGGDGQKQDGWDQNVGVNSRNDGWGQLGGAIRKQNSWGHHGDSGKQDGWGHNAGGNGHNNCWGHCEGGSGNDDGWGAIPGGESEGGWGNCAGKNQKHATWGIEGGRNDTKTGGGWGNKTGGIRSEQGWNANANASSAERSRSWNNRGSFRDEGSFRDAGLEPRNGKPRADTGPPHRDTGCSGRGPPSHTRPAVLAGTPRTEANGAGLGIDNEREKVWFYQDPSKTTQGPFSMEQLRKWEKTKLFPLDLRIWRGTESQDASILLTDALQGRLRNDLPPGFDQYSGKGSREDSRNAHVPGGGGPGSNWHDKGRRSKYNDWPPPERRNANHNDGGLGVRLERPWGPQEPDKLSPPDGRWDGPRAHWNRGSSHHQNPSDHHYPGQPSNDSRFAAKKKDYPCRYFARGMCKKGDECDFMH